jgi:hypothetical protein
MYQYDAELLIPLCFARELLMRLRTTYQLPYFLTLNITTTIKRFACLPLEAGVVIIDASFHIFESI